MNFLKMMMSFLAVFSMTVMPLAEAEAKKQDQKERINQYLKETGLSTGKMTVAEYWRMIRHTQPENMRQAMDLWVSNHRNEMMPQFDAVSFIDADGNEQTRLTAKIEGRTHNFTIMGGPDPKLKIDNVTFTKNEAGDFKKMSDRLVKEDKSLAKTSNKGKTVDFSNVVMTLDEVNKLTVRQQAEYLYRLRLALQLSAKVMERTYGVQAVNEMYRKLDVVTRYLFGETADAKMDLTGKTCVVAGYISIYGGKSQSCGGVGEGDQNLKQQMGQYGQSCGAAAPIPCNPLVYGFSDSGSAFCVPKAQVKYATANCNDQSPMHKDNAAEKARIIESYMKVVSGKNIKLHPNDKGEIPVEERAQIAGYLGDLNKLIDQSVELCTKSDEMGKIQVQRPDQKSACDNLMIRAFDLKTFAAAPEPPIELPPPMPKPPKDDCNAMKPGSKYAADHKSCRCPEGTEEKMVGGEDGGEGQVSCAPVIIPVDPPPRHREREKPQQNDCPVFQFVCDHPFLTIGGLAAIGGLIWWLWPRDPKCTSPMVPAGDTCIYPPVYQPPAGPLPPTSVCTSPAVLVGGVCQIPTIPNPPPVVVPPTAPSEGGTGTPSTGTSGGVR